MSRAATPPLYPRIAAVATAFGTLTLVLIGRVAWLAGGGETGPSEAAAANRLPVAAPRGTLWDREGRLLATETYAYELGVDLPALAPASPAVFAAAVAGGVGRPAEALEAAIREGLADKRRRWVPLGRGLSAETAEGLAAQEIDTSFGSMSLAALGLTVRRSPARSYPLGAEAAHVLGFMNFDGEAVGGIEAQYDALLRGQAGVLAGYRGTDPSGYQPGRSGADLRLTLDRDIQLVAARALRETVEAQHATGGSVIVMEPTTGAILALASWPAFDPANFAQADPASFLDPAIAAVYEPGSVIKALTVAAALEARAIRPDERYFDTGVIEVAGVEIPNWDRTAHGSVTITEMLQHSLNVGAVHVAEKLGAEGFYAALGTAGFGAPTALDLPGEVAGQVHWPDESPDWWPGYLANNAFGQGMAATPLQVITAMAALANEGVVPVPHLLAEVMPPTAAPEAIPTRQRGRLVSPETARTVRGMLAVVVDGNVSHAAIPGHSVGGKTGTSQIPIAGGYDPEDTIASFCGFLPVERPRVIILAKVDRPTEVLGSEAAAPLFRQVAEAAIAALDIPPDRPLPADSEVEP